MLSLDEAYASESFVPPPYRITMLTALAVLAGGGYLLANLLHPATMRMSNAWYIDEQDGDKSLNPADAISLPATSIAPLKNKVGAPTVVRAMFVTCTTEKDRRLVYLEKYTPQAQAAFAKVQSGAESPSPSFLSSTQAGHLIRLPDPGAPWVPINSAAGVTILNGIKCEHRVPTYCAPSQSDK